MHEVITKIFYVRTPSPDILNLEMAGDSRFLNHIRLNEMNEIAAFLYCCGDE